MRLENLLREKVFVLAQTEEISSSEKKIIQDILSENDLGELNSLSLIDQNDDNDSFKASTDLGQFCVKITLDEENKSLMREVSTLVQAVSKNIPYFIGTGSIVSVNGMYSITSYLLKQNVSELGRSLAISEKQSFVKSLAEVNQEKISARSFLDFLRDKYLNFSANELPGFDSIDFSKDAELLNIATEEIKFLKQQIQATYSSIFEGENLCHGNLTSSRILTAKSKFSFINFEDAYNGNPLIDLAGLKYELLTQDFAENSLKEEYRKYYSFSDDEYKKCAQMAKILKFFDLLVAYIKEVFVFRGVRQKKVLDLTTQMSRSFGLFVGLPSFDRHSEKIGKIFSTSVL